MQRYFAKQKSGDKLILNDNDLYHIKRVMRLRENDKIEVVYNGELFLCALENDDAKIVLKIDVEKNFKPNITLAIPLLKEQKMDLILQKATELGVSTIMPVIMEHSIIKITPDKQAKKIERWQKICKEASEQSKRLDIPFVTNICTLNDLECIDGVKLVCSTREKSKNLKNYLKNIQNYDKILLVIGPEGGLSKSEEEFLKKIGFTCISLGDRILRVETVPLFLLSVLSYESME